MNKKMISKLLCCALTAAMVAGTVMGCGAKDEPKEQAAAEEAVSEAVETAEEIVEEAAPETSEAEQEEESEEEAVGMADPWVGITEEEANESCLRLFKAPEGATDISWMKCDELGDPDKGIGPMIQLSFTLDDMYFTARAQQGAAEETDIAGNYVEWTVGPEDVTLANWGEGNMPGKTYRAVSDTGYVDMITWYDIEIGISYSLSVAAKDLDGFDIQAVAEQMYAGESEEVSSYAEDFLQDQSGKTSFDSYDDVIAALTPGQGYAYIKLKGSEEDFLAVTDLVFEYDHSACEVSIYGKPDGAVKQLGIVSSAGSAYPLRLEDGILYSGSNHTYETYFASEEYGSLMQKDYISDGIDTGSNEFSGFTREKNSFEDTKEFTGSQEEFSKLLSDRENKPIIEFTVVE